MVYCLFLVWCGVLDYSNTGADNLFSTDSSSAAVAVADLNYWIAKAIV